MENKASGNFNKTYGVYCDYGNAKKNLRPSDHYYITDENGVHHDLVLHEGLDAVSRVLDAIGYRCLGIMDEIQIEILNDCVKGIQKYSQVYEK